MEIIVKPKENLLFNAFLLIFVIHTSQVGIGILGFQRIVMKDAGHDAWIPVIIAGVLTHIVAWIMIKTLRLYESTDLFGIHEDVYGKIFGKVLSTGYIIYLFLMSIIPVRNYLEVVQTWLFPELPTWVLNLFILFLAWYGISGGIRAVVGFCFLGVIIPIWMILFLVFPYQYSDWEHLLPVMEATIPGLIKGTYSMGLTIIGFELLYFIYPFVKEKHLVNRYTQIGLLSTSILYLAVMVVSIIYYGEDMIMRYVWATLNLFKIVQMPILERFEFIAVAVWLLVILPNVLLTLWAASRGVKRVFNWKQKYALIAFLLLNFVICIFIQTRMQINIFNDLVGRYAPYLVFLYPFLLYFLARWTRKRKSKSVVKSG